jgi:hypothetical protein
LFTFIVFSELQKKCADDAIDGDTIAIAHDDDLQLIDSEDVVSPSQNAGIYTVSQVNQ